ncbi:DUF4179 domain-containing protein [Aneurinibacillus tyrosinisolvens]|uniref:DUF4179 domain-containing protein n=1 Tax=Aneurinibacillus tyrosinisolvens TaxID=1443435 RepID=UPI00069BB4A4|nr:DUF4179 domain-containing protein [Aneurinibacillus tyrosinisolvens]
MDNELKKWADSLHEAEVPKRLDLAIEQAIQKGKMDRHIEVSPNQHPVETKTAKGKTKHQKKWMYGVSSAAVVSLCIIGSGFFSPTMAETLKKVPILSHIFETYGDPGLKEANKLGLSTPVTQKATDQGITLTITDILFDGTRLSIGYKEYSPDGLPLLDFSKPRFRMDVPGWDQQQSGMDKTNENQIRGVWNLTWLEENALPDHFNLSMKVTQIGDKKGEWKFELPIQKIKTSTKVLNPMLAKKSKDVTLTVQSVSLSPRGTDIQFQTVSPPNAVTNMFYQVTDDHGAPLLMLEGGGFSSEESDDKTSIFQNRYLFTPAKGTTKFLVLRPYTDGYKNGDIITPLQNQLPQTIQQGEIGSFTIHRIDFLEDRTVLYYDVIGDNPYDQAGVIWLMNEKGEKLTDDAKGPHLVGVQNGRYSFIRDYPKIENKEKLKVFTYSMNHVHYFKDLEVKIPLN